MVQVAWFRIQGFGGARNTKGTHPGVHPVLRQILRVEHFSVGKKAILIAKGNFDSEKAIFVAKTTTR